MTLSRARGPGLHPAVVLFGLLGLIPFFAPLLVPTLAPAWEPQADLAQRLYAGLILSFLGGARFGRALEGPLTRIALSMAPPLFAFAALVASSGASARLLLALGLALQWLWDQTDEGTPPGYRRLRSVLSAAAVTALLLGVLGFPKGTEARARASPPPTRAAAAVTIRIIQTPRARDQRGLPQTQDRRPEPVSFTTV